jgi:hypothetical protein
MIRQLFSIALFLGSVGFSQGLSAQNSAAPDARLADRFSKKELKSLTNDELTYWTFYLDNCYLIVDVPKEKTDAVPASIKLDGLDKKDVNVFKLGLKPHAFARDYFRIEGTEKMLVVLPQTEIDQKLKELSK